MNCLINAYIKLFDENWFNNDYLLLSLWHTFGKKEKVSEFQKLVYVGIQLLKF